MRRPSRAGRAVPSSSWRRSPRARSRGTAVRYETDKAGSGFALSFGHLCLYDLGELRHFEYESWDDTWFSHAD
jgi:hypothetical protein